MYNEQVYENRMNQALEHFEAELAKIRTGRAHPALLDGIMVEAYGTTMPLRQVANVTVSEATQLLVTPFDVGNIAAISDAIRRDQTQGLNPSDDGRVIRVPVPPLTEERRRQLVRLAAERAESAKVALRVIRQDAIKELRRQKDAKTMGEDEVNRAEKAIDRLTGTFQERIDKQLQLKEKDILTV